MFAMLQHLMAQSSGANPNQLTPADITNAFMQSPVPEPGPPTFFDMNQDPSCPNCGQVLTILDGVPSCTACEWTYVPDPEGGFEDYEGL